MKKLPDFSLPDASGRVWTPADFARGDWILYAYPRDGTPGCTVEAGEFQKFLPDFKKLGVGVVGVSRDTARRHAAFAKNEGLDFPLLADPAFDFLEPAGLKIAAKMYGKPVTKVERATFFVRDGAVVREWRAVRAPGHAAEVLDTIRQDLG